MQYVQRGLVIALMGLLVGCGWQLRGAAGGGLDGVTIAVTGAAGNRLEAQIARQLRDVGADVVADAAQALQRDLEADAITLLLARVGRML